MRCPFCQAGDTKVIDSRLSLEGDSVRRRRHCCQCQQRFTTYECVELSLPRIVKRNGQREAFSEQKLRLGLLKAFEKRPVATEAIDTLIANIKKRLSASGEREIAAQQIGAWLMPDLQKIDEVAYVRFASVYRSFTDVQSFREELDRMQHSS